MLCFVYHDEKEMSYNFIFLGGVSNWYAKKWSCLVSEWFITGKSLSVTATRLFYNVELGDNVTLGVSIYPQESVLLSVQWVFHHKGIEQKINVSGSAKYFGSSLERPSLFIINLKTDDIGNYRCIAESSHGTGESGQIVLQIKGNYGHDEL